MASYKSDKPQSGIVVEGVAAANGKGGYVSYAQKKEARSRERDRARAAKELSRKGC